MEDFNWKDEEFWNMGYRDAQSEREPMYPNTNKYMKGWLAGYEERINFHSRLEESDWNSSWFGFFDLFKKVEE